MNWLAHVRAGSARSDNLIAGLFTASLLMIAPLTHAASCAINSVSNLNFGSYDPFASTALDMAATASITCTSTKKTARRWPWRFRSEPD
ncbi:spore coat protein U domain-containing protein [Undibacterium arcticum]